MDYKTRFVDKNNFYAKGLSLDYIRYNASDLAELLGRLIRSISYAKDNINAIYSIISKIYFRMVPFRKYILEIRPDPIASYSCEYDFKKNSLPFDMKKTLDFLDKNHEPCDQEETRDRARQLSELFIPGKAKLKIKSFITRKRIPSDLAKYNSLRERATFAIREILVTLLNLMDDLVISFDSNHRDYGIVYLSVLSIYLTLEMFREDIINAKPRFYLYEGICIGRDDIIKLLDILYKDHKKINNLKEINESIQEINTFYVDLCRKYLATRSELNKIIHAKYQYKPYAPQ